jgi:hypothetical protein
MKIKILMAVLLCTATVAHTQLIDLTPGGFHPDEGLPPVYYELINQTYFDEAAHGWFNLPWGDEYINGWVNLFGALDGGTYFHTNLFRLGDTPSANLVGLRSYRIRNDNDRRLGTKGRWDRTGAYLPSTAGRNPSKPA